MTRINLVRTPMSKVTKEAVQKAAEKVWGAPATEAWVKEVGMPFANALQEEERTIVPPPLPKFSLDSYGWVTSTDKSGGRIQSQRVEAQLLYAILQRLPDPKAPLPEAVEWESLDGLNRTTDKRIAQNMSLHGGVRVVRRAGQ
jgi:hypothetical protein